MQRWQGILFMDLREKGGEYRKRMQKLFHWKQKQADYRTLAFDLAVGSDPWRRVIALDLRGWQTTAFK